MRILIIEDDTKVSSYIRKGLTEKGHTVFCAATGKEGLALAASEIYDALIIDRMVPAPDGLAIIKTLRASGNHTPALFLSSLGAVDDRVDGLRAGGDDYLIKPFAFAELLARIEALVRRPAAGSESEAKLTAGDLEMNRLSRKVTRGAREIDLQTREFKLLEYLIRNKGRLVTRTMLLENVWDYNFDPQTNVIDVHISRLRGKVDKGFEKPLIKTVRGSGYILDE